MTEIVNKVAASGLVTIRPEDLVDRAERVVIDLAGQLWQGLALREKDFREWVRAHDWQQYAGKHVAIHCSADAIVPLWAFMLVASKLQPVATTVYSGDARQLEEELYRRAIAALDAEAYRDQRLVIKGCGDVPVPASAYVALVEKLQPVARSLMFGEPCSTVPVYKR